MQSKVILCEKCNDQYSIFGYSSHYKKCDGISKKIPKTKYIPKPKSQKWIDAMHARRGEGTNQYTKAEELGLPKPVISNETRALLQIGPKNRIWTNEQRENMAEHARRRGLGGKFINGRYSYNGQSFASSYEIRVAQSLDENSIEWIKCKETFKYIGPDNKQRTYLPDFYLPQFDIYLDPKNDFLINSINPSLGFNDCEKIKIVEEVHNIRVLILDKSNLTWNNILSLINCP